MKMKRQNRKREQSVKMHIDEAFDYVRQSRKFIYWIIGIFCFFTLFGFFVLPLSPGISEIINNSLKNIVDQTQDLSGVNLILFIFANNVSVAFYSLFSGIILGIYPVISLIINGSVIGYVLAKVYILSGITNFWMLIPHGIFELPAVFISLGLGVKLGAFIFSKNKVAELKYRLWNSIRVFLFVIIPLLTIAAIIEGLLITLFK